MKANQFDLMGFHLSSFIFSLSSFILNPSSLTTQPFFSWFYWNPNREIFTIPVIDRPIVWYGFWFVFGFIVGYFLLISMFQQVLQLSRGNSGTRQLAQSLVDKLTWFVVAGTLIGARLGHVFFYDWPRYKHNLFDIVKIWEGGLASHGGTVGVMLGLFLYQRMISKQFPEFTLIRLLDLLAVPAAFVACCIRIGNFWNQEILGVPTTVPWAIIFGDPLDGSAAVPRHPVQLYEAAAYLLIFFILLTIWRLKGTALAPGKISGLFFVLAFTARFFIEFLKTEQSAVFPGSFLQIGQLLSIPFILLGFYLLFHKKQKGQKT